MKSTLVVYMLACRNGAYYVGYTNDLARRFRQHCAGTAKCKYTKSFPPLKIAAYWEINGTRGEALRLEKSLQKLSHRQKQHLAMCPHDVSVFAPTSSHLLTAAYKDLPDHLA